jgi:Holliday junction resolvase-like predicted endonuclease
MHPELLARALSGISPETTAEEFRVRASMISKPIAENVLDFLSNNGIGTLSGSKILFSNEDRIKIAILAIKMGCDIEQISKKLTWKDFEALASKILKLSGYKTAIHVTFSKPRMEIDVVGIKSKFAITVDCKHWKHDSIAILSFYTKRQIERTKILLVKKSNISFAIPIILTLHSTKVRFIKGTPIVPITEFKSFLDGLEDNLLEVYVLYR